MKYYLLALLIIIMAAGARTMFEVAYQGMAGEHDATPSGQTLHLILLAFWFVGMMICDVLILGKKNLPFRNWLIALLSVGVLGPVVYMIYSNQ